MSISISFPEWEEFLARHPQAHLLQTGQWGQLKTEFGWQARHIIVGDAGVQVLFRRLPLGLSIAYIPKGPIGIDQDQLWGRIDQLCKQERAIFLKVDPDNWETDNPARPDGFSDAKSTVQPPRTITLDISLPEETLLANMKQKTRYNIRLAQRKGVMVSESDDVDAFNRLMAVTGERDAFGVHSSEYYVRAHEIFQPHGLSALLIAEHDHQPLAALMVFGRGERAWYLYGASSNEKRNLMPTYLLQWEAIRWAKAQGCTEYDLWGVPDEDEETLEANFQNRHDGLWGVYRFKRGFGGRLQRAAGPWDRVYMPVLFKLFQRWVNR
jgi:lipid II:glycine glycyltransferase (peptidoglycan interpeptide bridge formation enzyme)